MKPQRQTLDQLRRDFIAASAVLAVLLLGAAVHTMVLQ
jgi:hypothetical protein